MEEMEMTNIEFLSRDIADGADFSDFDEQHPTPCYYVKTAYTLDEEHEEVTEKVFLSAELEANTSNIPVEYRGITFYQLKSVWENVRRRCIPEKWTDFQGNLLTPETVTLYDVNKYIIMPYTVHSKNSFVESLPSTMGPQPPRWFVSHYWGEPIECFILCIEKFVKDFSGNSEEDHEERGGGMSEHTPMWVCAYANNQWDLGDDITVDPSKSGFTRAIEVAENRTITILDDQGVVFTRIWCIYELYRTLIANLLSMNKKNTRWVLYTVLTDGGPARHSAEGVGIVSNIRTTKVDEGDYKEVYAYQRFPFELIKKALKIQIENANASVMLDRIRILNAITGRQDDFDVTPPETHEKYDELNNALQGAIAGSIPILQAATSASDEDWKEIMVAFSKGTHQNEIDFHFPDGFRKSGTNPGGWAELTPNQFGDLIIHLPVNVGSLIIRNPEFGSLGPQILQNLMKWMRKSKSLTKLHLECWYFGTEEDGAERNCKEEFHACEAGVHLAEAIAHHTKIESLILFSTNLFGSRNVSNWVQAIGKNTNLKLLIIGGAGKNEDLDEDDEIHPDLRLTDEGCEVLAEGIGSNQSLERLFLSGLDISKEGVLAFGPALKQNKTITEMSIFSTMYSYGQDEDGKTDEVKEAMKKLENDLKDHVPGIDMSTESLTIFKEFEFDACVIS